MQLPPALRRAIEQELTALATALRLRAATARLSECYRRRARRQPHAALVANDDPARRLSRRTHARNLCRRRRRPQLDTRSCDERISRASTPCSISAAAPEPRCGRPRKSFPRSTRPPPSSAIPNSSNSRVKSQRSRRRTPSLRNTHWLQGDLTATSSARHLGSGRLLLRAERTCAKPSAPNSSAKPGRGRSQASRRRRAGNHGRLRQHSRRAHSAARRRRNAGRALSQLARLSHGRWRRLVPLRRARRAHRRLTAASRTQPWATKTKSSPM